MTVAFGLTVGEFAPVSAVVVAVNTREVGDDMWGPMLVTQRSNGFFYFQI